MCLGFDIPDVFIVNTNMYITSIFFLCRLKLMKVLQSEVRGNPSKELSGKYLNPLRPPRERTVLIKASILW